MESKNISSKASKIIAVHALVAVVVHFYCEKATLKTSGVWEENWQTGLYIGTVWCVSMDYEFIVHFRIFVWTVLIAGE